jgi:hypothetical protein
LDVVVFVRKAAGGQESGAGIDSDRNCATDCFDFTLDVIGPVVKDEAAFYEVQRQSGQVEP